MINNTERNILIAGFGGQGIVLVGNVLAYACVNAGKNVLAMASYGAEVRGGTAKGIIAISDEEIDSPIINIANLALIMNTPSYVKYIETVEEGSIVVANSSMIDDELTARGDFDIVKVDATNMALRMGNSKVANLIMLGALIKKTGILEPESIFNGMRRVFSKGKKGLYYINESAFRMGFDLV